MTAKTDLLPLPEPVAVKYPDSGLRDDEHALRLWAAHGYDTGGEPLFSAEQLREATAPLLAEIEALRAEVERANSWNERVSVCRDHVADIVDGPCVICALGAAQASAERLAEALRGWWEARRPVGWTEDQHRSCPHVNLATDAEKALATALLRNQEEGR